MTAILRGKMEHNVNFKVDEEFKGYIQELCFETGYSVSDLLRQALLLAGPTILASPEYASRITLADVDLSKIKIRDQ